MAPQRSGGLSVFPSDCGTDSNVLSHCFDGLTVNGPLEKFKNSYQNTSGADPILILNGTTGDRTGGTDACSSSTVTNGVKAKDDGTNDTTALASDFDYKGVLVVTPHGTTDNLSKTNNFLQIGYCDGDSNYQEITDNISF